MGLRVAISALIFSAGAAVASPQTDQLVDAMGIPALIAAFSTEGIENGASVDDGILNGQGGNVWAETVRRLYDPARLEEEMRAAFAETLGTPLTDALAAHGTLLASVAEPVPEGAVPLDLAREWTDLTLRPFVWGLLAIREDGVSADTARQLGEAVRTAGPLDALFVDGVAAFQLTLDGYAIDGLDEFTEHLFATGTLSEIPGLPFIELVSKKGGLAEDEER